MAGVYRPGVGSAGSSSLYQPGSTRSGFTQYQREVTPYVREIRAREKEKSNLLQMTEWLFDVLSVGQYASANMVEEAFEAVREGVPLPEAIERIGLGAWQGLTRERRGDFTNLLPEDWNPWVRKGLGFVLNVVADPLNYINPFGGATKASKVAAGAYAADRLALAMKNPEFIESVAKGIRGNADEFVRLAAKNPDAARAAFGTDFAREIDKFYRRAYREGLKISEKEARDKIRGQLLKLQPDLTDQYIENLISRHQAMRASARRTTTLHGVRVDVPGRVIDEKVAHITSKAYADELKSKLKKVISGELSPDSLPEGLSELVRRDLDEMPEKMRAILGASGDAGLVPYDSKLNELVEGYAKNYAHMGERSIATVFGRELGVGHRRPGFVSRQWETFKEALEGTKVPFTKKNTTLGDAWWSVMNRGVIGKIRQAFGFRSPYQNLLNVTKQNIQRGFRAYQEDIAQETLSVFRGFDEKTMREFTEIKAFAERMKEILAEVGADPNLYNFDDALRTFGYYEVPNVGPSTLSAPGVAGAAPAVPALNEAGEKLRLLNERWEEMLGT